jgi:nucleotide-binding universal stress UspA family protein
MNQPTSDKRSAGEAILVAVDDSDAARRALNYVAHMLDGRGDTRVDLYHRLPALPPELREHGGSEDPKRETELGRQLAKRIAEWVDGLKSGLVPNLEALKRELVDQGMNPSSIEFCIDEDVFPGESLADALRRVAADRDCHTIAIARDHLTGVHEFFRHHTGDALVRHGAGFAVWVVE